MLRLLSFLVLTFSLAPVNAQAQQYPDHPVKLVVGYAAGSGPDIQARTVAQQLSVDLGQQFFVENRLGANGTIATRSVVQSKPDGYTLLYTSNGIGPTPYIYKNLGYDIFTDLTPIATVGILDGLFMLVDAKSPYKTLQEFIDHAKKDRAIYGSPGVGNGLHLAAEIFSKKAGIEMQHIPYKGASEVMTGMTQLPTVDVLDRPGLPMWIRATAGRSHTPAAPNNLRWVSKPTRYRANLLDQGFAAGAFRQVGSDKRVPAQGSMNYTPIVPGDARFITGKHPLEHNVDIPTCPNGHQMAIAPAGALGADLLLRPTCGRSKGQQHLDRCRCCAVHSTIAHDTATYWIGPALRAMPMSSAPAALCG